ncbi:hypothetical protein [Azospirillum argentinense]|uniref:hypothetical protein n=1 Tax=Azospirillum argentinense TaxID=2970906 RepID=UPI001185FFBF|nr:hypothetical protein [Azospirillum argentinense]
MVMMILPVFSDDWCPAHHPVERVPVRFFSVLSLDLRAPLLCLGTPQTRDAFGIWPSENPAILEKSSKQQLLGFRKSGLRVHSPHPVVNPPLRSDDDPASARSSV